MENARNEKKELIEIEIYTEEQKQQFALIKQIASHQRKTADQLFQEVVENLCDQNDGNFKALIKG